MRKQKSEFNFLTGPHSMLPRLSFVFLCSLLGPSVVLAQPSDPTSPAESASGSPAEAPPSAMPPTEAGAAAVQRVRNLGFRLNSKESPAPSSPASPEPGPPTAEPSPESPPAAIPGPMKLGKVEEPVTLPPELAEISKEAALAVANGDWAQARALYLKLVDAAPDNALAYANLGVAEHQLGNLLAAAGNLSRSVTLNPHIARNWRTLGLIQYERGEVALAISSLLRAVHEDPRDAETRIILAAAARDFDWPAVAEVELRRAVELAPQHAAAHYNLAVTYLDSDPPRIELARRHYYAAIDLGADPSPELEALLKPGE